MVGNALIALGAVLLGIGGSFARAGTVDVLYVTEIGGQLMIWAGYRTIVGDDAVSIHTAQRRTAGENQLPSNQP